jgi:hypothetical protein
VAEVVPVCGHDRAQRWQPGAGVVLGAERVRELELRFEALHLPDASGRRLLTRTAAPGRPSEAALRLPVDHRG